MILIVANVAHIFDSSKNTKFPSNKLCHLPLVKVRQPHTTRVEFLFIVNLAHRAFFKLAKAKPLTVETENVEFLAQFFLELQNNDLLRELMKLLDCSWHLSQTI